MGSENLTFPIAYVETAKAEHPATSFISEIRQVTCFYAVIIRSPLGSVHAAGYRKSFWEFSNTCDEMIVNKNLALVLIWNSTENF